MRLAASNTTAGRLCLVLDALLRARGPATFAQIQAATGIERRALFRYLAALESVDFVVREDGLTSIGPKLRAPSEATR